jgi:hypothetical protein
MASVRDDMMRLGAMARRAVEANERQSEACIRGSDDGTVRNGAKRGQKMTSTFVTLNGLVRVALTYRVCPSTPAPGFLSLSLADGGAHRDRRATDDSSGQPRLEVKVSVQSSVTHASPKSFVNSRVWFTNSLTTERPSDGSAEPLRRVSYGHLRLPCRAWNILPTRA